MNNFNQLGMGSERYCAPLCRSYLLAMFDDLCVYAYEAGAARHWRFRWAIGVLADGQHEVLGMWHDSASDAVNRQEASDDLVRRGVERIRVIAGIEPNAELRVRRAYPSSKSLTSIGQFLRKVEADLTERDLGEVSDFAAKLYAAGTLHRARELVANFAAGPVGVRYPAARDRWSCDVEQLGPIHNLSPGLRRRLRVTDSTAQQVNRNLRRATARHGCFPSLSVATSFIEQTLVRTERKLGVFEAAHTARRAHRGHE